MFKTITIFKNIKDYHSLINFYVSEIFPVLHKLPGVIRSDLVKVSELGTEYSEDTEGIQMMLETTFESSHTFHKILESPEGAEIKEKMGKSSVGEMFFYQGQIKRFEANKEVIVDDFKLE